MKGSHYFLLEAYRVILNFSGRSDMILVAITRKKARASVNAHLWPVNFTLTEMCICSLSWPTLFLYGNRDRVRRKNENVAFTAKSEIMA